MQKESIIGQFFKRPIAYHPIIAKAFDSVKLGIFWSQLYYWHDKGSDQDGWIYKTRTEIYDETGLSRKEQETARKLGLKLGIIEEKLSGRPATLHFKIDIDRAFEIVESYIESQNTGQLKIKEVLDKPTNTIAYLKDLPKQDIQELSDRYIVSEKFIRERADDVIDYCESHGKHYSNYKAALRNFIKSHLKSNPEERQNMIRKKREEAEELQRQQESEKFKNRTSEEQARINKKLDMIRSGLANKVTIKK